MARPTCACVACGGCEGVEWAHRQGCPLPPCQCDDDETLVVGEDCCDHGVPYDEDCEDCDDGAWEADRHFYGRLS